MNTAVANATSCSLVAPSCLRQRFSISNSSSCVCSLSLRLPRQNLYHGEMKEARLQCSSAMNTQQYTKEIDIPVYASSVEERCAEEGIRCYRNEDGDVTCEGFDEGPHFHPVARAQQRTMMKYARCVSFLSKGVSADRSAQRSTSSELSSLSVVQVGAKGECYCEGKDES